MLDSPPIAYCHLAIIPAVVLIETVVLILSMKIVSHLRGGIDFGDVEPAIFKAAALVTGALAVQGLVPFGTWVALPVWFVGLYVLFWAGVWVTMILAFVNWWLSLALTQGLQMFFG